MGMHAGEESDGCIVPVKPRTMPSDVGGGDGGGKAAGRGEGELRPHAPDTAPEPACHRSGEPTDRSCMGTPYPEGRSRLTRDRSRMRETRTSGTARRAKSYSRPYRDPCSQAEAFLDYRWALYRLSQGVPRLSWAYAMRC